MTKTVSQNTCVETFSGRLVDVMALRPGDVDLLDIAVSLSRQCRFNGHCRFFYSVAQHSVLCSHAPLPVGAGEDSAAARMALLLHDAGEAYLGDITRPIKHLCPALIARERSVLLVVLARLAPGVVYSRHADLVRGVDRRMLATEKRDLMGAVAWPGPPGEPFEELVIAETWAPELACERFDARYRQLRALRDERRAPA